MHPSALLTALRNMGYSKEDMTTHGFRGIASTLLKEIHKDKTIRSLVIELQLSHTVKGKVESAYDSAIYLEERIFLMQWWADYLDSLKNGAQIIPFNKAG
jgi:hypothetical protein